jgi:hypothetical protein
MHRRAEHAGRSARGDALPVWLGLLAGMGSALVAWLCCLPAAAALALGLSGASLLISLTAFHGLFLGLGGVGLGVALWLGLRRGMRVCAWRGVSLWRGLTVPVAALVVFGVTYLFIERVVLPWLYLQVR